MISRNDRVSFIIPAYNCASTIEESVNSIINGNLEARDEIVIVDDGSNHDTSTVLSQLESNSHAIRVITHEYNKGGYAARNTAVENARHDLIFCLDSDNILVPGSVSRWKAYLREAKLDVTGPQEVKFFRESIHKVTHSWVFREGLYTFADYLSMSRVPGASGNYLYTRASWLRAKGYPEVPTLDAWGFGLRQVATGAKMAVAPDTHYFHRYGHESNWVRENRKGRTSLAALQVLIPFFPYIHEDDIDYMMSAPGRYWWFENLSTRPVRVLSESRTKPYPKGLKWQVYNILMKSLFRLKGIVER
jgi:glycosyltransferase involved in cell wall biosynthesis